MFPSLRHTLRSRPRNRNVPVLVVEHQAVDLFSLNRLIAELRWRI